MNTPDSQEIVVRFFECVRALKTKGRMKFISEFTERHGIRHTTFQQAELDPSSNRFQVAWIRYLHKDYGVSIEYIISGRGRMFPRRSK